MDERPVTGSCEQCGRTYTLLIPVPGSGSLKFQRVRDAFGWCIDCGQFVGRACCWGTGQRCVQCVKAHADGEPGRETGGFAALAAARAAVRQLDGTAVEFSKVDASIDAVGGADAASAIGAWDDAWLAAGTLDARLDSMREATVALLGAIPSGEAERSLELEQELGAVLEAHAARWQSITDRLVAAGRRLPASAAAEALHPAASASPSPARELAPTSAPAIAVAVPLPIDVPDRVTVTVASERRTQSALASVPVGTASSTKAPIIVRTKAGLSSPQRAVVAPPRVPEVRRPGEAPFAAAPPDGATGAPVPSVRAASGQGRPATGSPQVSWAGRGAGRRGTRLAGLAVVVGLAAVGGMLAVSIGQLGRDVGGAATAGADPVGGAGGEPSASAATGTATVSPPTPSAGVGSATAPQLFLTFDLHPVGPLDPVELSVARIIGTPEVVAFPTPFDRSLRLAGASTGACFELPASETASASSMAFDVHLDEVGSDGLLLVVLAADDGDGARPLAIDVGAARELDPDAWYRFEVTSVGDAGHLVVAPVNGGQAILEAALRADPGRAPASTDQACIQSALPDGASLTIDNLRVER